MRGRPAVPDGEQRADADDAENRPQHAAGKRQDDALGQQLAHDAASARADRSAHSNLAAPPGRAHEQQVGDVRAGDQEHEAHGADEDQQRRADVGHERLTHRDRHKDGTLTERVGELGRASFDESPSRALACSRTLGARRAAT